MNRIQFPDDEDLIDCFAKGTYPLPGRGDSHRFDSSLSYASILEVAIKISLNKLFFEDNTSGFLDLVDANGFELLPIDKEPILQLEKLLFIVCEGFNTPPFRALLGY
ncbi:MAG: hypothetical protein LBR10_01445 [Prevotellaceae bacterium]|jgi:hypothetical protein|nr:hypothetical protein [Prevotellaceae bacterium]